MSSFAATLSDRDRRLAGRLEGFGDIVFGFAVSQSALQLPLDRGHVDLSQPIPLLLYLGTFAIIASLWMIFHRLMSGSFLPTGIDLFAAFAYLAFVSLIPYALFAISHDFASKDAARSAIAQYAGLYGMTTALAAVLTLRNLQRGWGYVDLPERDRLWQALVRRIVLVVIMSIATAFDFAFGPAIAGLFLALTPVAIRAARFLFSRAPKAARLGIVEAR